jgi:hypothetical protein
MPRPLRRSMAPRNFRSARSSASGPQQPIEPVQDRPQLMPRRHQPPQPGHELGPLRPHLSKGLEHPLAPCDVKVWAAGRGM